MRYTIKKALRFVCPALLAAGVLALGGSPALAATSHPAAPGAAITRMDQSLTAAYSFNDGNITCTLFTEIVYYNFLQGLVNCSAPVDEIYLEAWGEDKSGNTTWISPGNTCYDTDVCDLDAAGDLKHDHKATFCGTTEWAGLILGDCQDVPDYHPN